MSQARRYREEESRICPIKAKRQQLVSEDQRVGIHAVRYVAKQQRVISYRSDLLSELRDFVLAELECRHVGRSVFNQ